MIGAWKVFQAALKKLPQLRYVLGAAGIFGIVAVVRSFTKDLKEGALSFVCLVAFSIIVFLFIRLTRSDDGEIRGPIQVLIWTSTILFAAAAVLLFTFAFFDWPRLAVNAAPDKYVITKGDRKIFYIESQIVSLRADWNALSGGDVARASQISRNSLKNINELDSVPDSTLGPGGLLTKKEYGCFAYVMAADVESNTDVKLTLANQAKSACDAAKKYIEQVKMNRDKNDSYAATYKFIIENEVEEWMEYLYASTFCTTGILLKNGNDVARSNELLHKLNGSYIQESAPQYDSVFKNCYMGENR